MVINNGILYFIFFITNFVRIIHAMTMMYKLRLTFYTHTLSVEEPLDSIIMRRRNILLIRMKTYFCKFTFLHLAKCEIKI